MEYTNLPRAILSFQEDDLHDPFKLGALVQYARESLLYSQERLAKAFGIWPSTVSKIECGTDDASQTLRIQVLDFIWRDLKSERHRSENPTAMTTETGPPTTSCNSQLRAKDGWELSLPPIHGTPETERAFLAQEYQQLPLESLCKRLDPSFEGRYIFDRARVGKIVRLIRMSLHQTQLQLAVAFGVSKGAVSKLEGGSPKASQSMRFEILAFLEEKLAEFRNQGPSDIRPTVSTPTSGKAATLKATPQIGSSKPRKMPQ